MSARDTLIRDGFVVARDVFEAAEIAELRKRFAAIAMRATYDSDKNYPRLLMPHGDAASHHELRDFDYVIFEPRIVSLVRELLGEVVYHGDSSIQIGEGPRGFHKDNADRGNPSGTDWQGEYGLIRMGLYLQDHSRHSGGLKVRVGSHRYVSHHRGLALNVDSRAGDLVFWYLTTSHSGNAIRVPGLPSLHPRVESLVPTWLRSPEQTERRSLFSTFGTSGAHLERYLEYQSGRADMRRHLANCAWGSDVRTLAARRGVVLRSWDHPQDNLGAHSAA
jgi:hypothetical protein